MLPLGESLTSTANDPSLTSIMSSAVRSANARTSKDTSGDAVRNAIGRGTKNTSTVQAGSAQVPSTDAGVKAYEAAAQKMAAAAGTTGGSEAAAKDPKVAAAVAQLKATDTAVRAHEAAHVTVGGAYVRGAANFTYQTGPDGSQYAIGGEVSIDTSPVPGNPEATIRKMGTVRAAALAPADPSAQDRAVAATAAQQAAAAQVELSQQQTPPVQPGQGRTVQTQTDQVNSGRGLISLVQAAYAAASEPTAEPLFQAAA